MLRTDMIKIHEFDPQIYPRKLWIAITDKAVFDAKPLDEAAAAEVIDAHDGVNGGVLIRFRNKKSLTSKHATHEAVHAAMLILEYAEVKLDYQNQEPLAYLAGWVSECIDEVKRFKPKIDISANKKRGED
mgnify:CR=1 FL=1